MLSCCAVLCVCVWCDWMQAHSHSPFLGSAAYRDKGGIWKVFTQSFSKEASAHTENPFTAGVYRTLVVLRPTLQIVKSFPELTYVYFGAERVVTGMFVGNFVGIVFARSLHYQVRREERC